MSRNTLKEKVKILLTTTHSLTHLSRKFKSKHITRFHFPAWRTNFLKKLDKVLEKKSFTRRDNGKKNLLTTHKQLPEALAAAPVGASVDAGIAALAADLSFPDTGCNVQIASEQKELKKICEKNISDKPFPELLLKTSTLLTILAKKKVKRRALPEHVSHGQQFLSFIKRRI